jgi:hypothetical protein
MRCTVSRPYEYTTFSITAGLLRFTVALPYARRAIISSYKATYSEYGPDGTPTDDLNFLGELRRLCEDQTKNFKFSGGRKAAAIPLSRLFWHINSVRHISSRRYRAPRSVSPLRGSKQRQSTFCPAPRPFGTL